MKLRAIALGVVALCAAVFFTPAMQAQAYPPTTCPGMLSLSTTTPLAGETITVTGADFTPGAQVHLVLHTKVFGLGTFKADSQGGFTAQVTLPEGVTGGHVISATSGAPHITQCPGVHVQIHAPAGTSAGPPGHHGTSFTGVDILLVVLVAAGLLGVGVALTRGGKQRHGPTAG
jgi:alpha-L-fucosidase